MNCPNCKALMEREDDLEYNGLYRAQIPSATYVCSDCGNTYYWRLNQPLQNDIDNRNFIKGLDY